MPKAEIYRKPLVAKQQQLHSRDILYCIGRDVFFKGELLGGHKDELQRMVTHGQHGLHAGRVEELFS